MRTMLLLTFASIAILGCGAGASEQRGPTENRLSPRRLYPLTKGNVWSYDLTDETNELPVLLISRVVSKKGDRYEIQTDGADHIGDVCEVTDRGIFRPNKSAWLLRAPVTLGATWPGPTGATIRVDSIQASASTPAGEFHDCVSTRETGGELGANIHTVFCPDIGIVLIEAETEIRLTGQQKKQVAKLRGFSFATDPPPL